jgi:hypothetical protein
MPKFRVFCKNRNHLVKPGGDQFFGKNHENSDRVHIGWTQNLTNFSRT